MSILYTLRRLTSKQLSEKRGQGAMSIIILLLAGMSLVHFLLMRNLDSIRSNQSIAFRDERNQVERLLKEEVDCAVTLSQLAMTTREDWTTKCSPSFGVLQNYFVELLTTQGDHITEEYFPQDTQPSQELGYGRYGKWEYRAGCALDGPDTAATTKGCLIIHAARVIPGRGANVQNRGDFKPSAMGNGVDSWKKLSRSPFENCCFDLPPP